jgi:hypothetical protein
VSSSTNTLPRYLGLTLILLLAAAARLHGIADRTVWTDEGWSAWAASDHQWDAVVDKLAHDNHPPLYFLALSGWWTQVGDSRLALRYLEILTGIFTTAVVYRIGADWFTEWAGRYAALLFAVLGIAVYYTQEIRHYGWVMLAVSLMTLFLLRYLRRPRALWLILYMFSVALMLYTHYIGILMIAAQGAITLVFWHGSWRAKGALILAWVGAVLVGFPWASDLISHTRRIAGEGAIKGVPGTYTTTWPNLVTLVGLLLGGQIALMLGLYGIGLIQIVRDYRWKSMQGLAQGFIVLTGSGLFVAMSITNLREGTLSARTLVYLTPLLMLVCGYGLSRLPHPADYALAFTAVIAMLSVQQIIQPRLDYDHVAQTVAAAYTPGDPVILEAGWDDNAFKYELSLALPVDDDLIIRTLPWVDHTHPERNRPVVPEILPLLETQRRFWVVQWLQPDVVISYFEQNETGFIPVWSQDISTGEQYHDTYPAFPTVRAVLFERPTITDTPTAFGDVLGLHDAVLPDQLSGEQRLHVDLWWTALNAPTLDYSVGVYVMPLNEDRVIVQSDQAPGTLPTSQWAPGDLIFDRHTLSLPDDLPSGTYRIAVKVYWFGDNQPLSVNNNPYQIVGQFEYK